MAVVEEELHDAKAGYSSYCRRDEHAGCRSAQAKCTCSCHGRNGQSAPAPFKPAVAAVPTKAVASVKCGECGRTFDGAHGLSVHKARSHKAAASPVKSKPATVAIEDPPDELWIVVVVLESADEIRLEGLQFPTEAEAVRVGDFLSKLDQRCAVLGPTT